MTIVRIVVDSRLRVSLSELPAGAATDLRAAFTHDNPQFGKLGEPERYETWRDEPGGILTLPRGGMGRAREVLRSRKLAWTVSDERTWRHPEPSFPDHRRVLRPYQERMFSAMQAKQNCIVHGSTGSGKTTAGYALLARLKRRFLVMLWTAGLLKQWRERAVEELGMDPEDVGHVQGDTEKIRPLTLCMQQTMAARFGRGDFSLVDEFDGVLLDECQRGGAPTVYAAVDPFRARYRIGLSADSSRRDEKEFLTRDLFGDVAAEITEEETIEAGATVDVEVCAVPTDFKAPWYRFRQDFNKLLAQMTEDEERNDLALGIAKSMIDQGEQVLLFTHRVEHARKIDAKLAAMGVKSGAMLGGVENAVAFQRAADGFRSGKNRAGVGTYQAIAQGIDLPTVSRGICLTPVGNNRQQLGQVRGRICRSSDGKDFGRLVYLWDRHVYNKKPVRNFVSWFRTVKVLQGDEWVDGAAWLRRRGE